MENGNIKPINRNSVHKICSGQVVLTLATAVKELVENSIDAGASIIDIKLKEYGSELVEVSDNGKGVKSSDFQNLTLKHHTSKINDFSDVPFVSTFGFRGEALSSLCALSQLEIITCHEDSSVGSHLTYNNDGTLIKNVSSPRQTGTTVSLKNLFFTLPVRYKEFHRNIRKEYAKMIHLLTAYCLISTNKRITCTNITDKGRKNIVLSTNNFVNVRDNIACIFGSKQVNNLMEFIQRIPSETILEEYFLKKSVLDKCETFKIEGFISNSTHGEGRSSSDRQFFYINRRPCDLPKVSKLINEVYHSFNKTQYPFVLLNIVLTEGCADVNVTPDKRQIFILEEKLLLAIVKTSLLEMYQQQPSQMSVSLSSVLIQKKLSDSFGKGESPNNANNLEFSLKRKIYSNTEEPNGDLLSPPNKSLKTENSPNKHTENSNKLILISGPKDCSLSSQETQYSSTDTKLDNSKGLHSEIVNVDSTSLSNNDLPSIKKTTDANNVKAAQLINKSSSFCLKDVLKNACRKTSILTNFDLYNNPKSKEKVKPCEKILSFIKQKSPVKDDRSSTLNSLLPKSVDPCLELSTPVKENEVVIDKPDDESQDVIAKLDNLNEDVVKKPDNENKDVTNKPDEDACFEKIDAVDEPQNRQKRNKNIVFCMEELKKEFAVRKKRSEESATFRKFRSKISPTDNAAAEEELKKEINKENFSQMDIIGQFNLGFIITRLNKDLFIIDQHATDEKYNFETLQKETVLETQKLLNPQNLNLTAVSEAVLLENISIFERSGFKFNINEDNPVGNKVQLISAPVSQNWNFGKEDVDEMIFMLTDNPVSMVRPSRVNQMFASRACRKSVMIGTALTTPMMKKLVVHMGEIEQPWNCPHGRPTIRHLFNLNLLCNE